MTSITPFVTARVITAQAPQLISGKGYIEKALGDDTFIISLASGKTTVRCASGSLSEGDAVFVKMQGNDLIIAKTPHQPPSQGNPDVQDSLDLGDCGGGGSANLKSLGSSFSIGDGLSLCLQGPKAPSEGFYYFDSIDKAIAWLSIAGGGSDKKNLQSILEKVSQGPVILNVIETENEGVKAFFLSPQSAGGRLSFFAREYLRSGLWSFFLPDGLMSLLQERKSLPLQRLIALDTVLPKNVDCDAFFPNAENKSPEGIAPSMGKAGAGQLFAQWLTTALDESTPLSILSLSKAIPASAELPPLIDKIQSMRQPDSNTPLSSVRAEDFSVDRPAMDGPKEKETLVPKLLERLGIDFENTFLRRPPSDDGAREFPASLKQVLLKLSIDLDAALGRQDRPMDKEPILNLYCAGRDLSDTWLKASGRFLRELFQPIEKLFPQRETGSANGTPYADGDQLKPLLEQFQEWSQRIGAMSENIAATISEQAETIRETAGQFVRPERQGNLSPHRNTGDIVNAVSEFDRIVQSIALKVKTLLENISAAVEKTSHAITSQSQARSEMREIAFQASRIMRDISSLVDQADRQSSRFIDKTDLLATARQEEPSIEMTRRLVETALQRIEAMQISAKPAVNGDERSQVVMVPMNIDGEWNDVIVKFVRDNGKSQNNGERKNTTVIVNVAPTFLGEITAAINYKGTNDCSMRMTFDKDKTLSWFKANQKEFLDAFDNLGFTGLKIDMQKSDRHRSATRTEAVQTADTAIDIVI